MGFMKLYDLGSNGSMDRISGAFEVPKNDQDAALMALGLSYRLVEVASRTRVDLEEFSDWFHKNLKRSMREEVVRSFGRTRVRIQATLIASSPGVRLTIER